MAVVKDASGNEWRVTFDAFNLDDTKKQAGIDLADITAGGWEQVETDSTAAVRVLAVVCAEEIKARKMTARQFANQFRGDVIQDARAALLEEAADFFPRSEWSAIRANLEKRANHSEQMKAAKMAAQMTDLIPMMEAFSRLPQGIQDKLVASGGDTASLTSEEIESVSGQTATPSSAATDLPENVELTAVG